MGKALMNHAQLTPAQEEARFRASAEVSYELMLADIRSGNFLATLEISRANLLAEGNQLRVGRSGLKQCTDPV